MLDMSVYVGYTTQYTVLGATVTSIIIELHVLFYLICP